MRIVALSDTHNRHDQVEVPPGDVLIHAGDACVDGSIEELEAFLDWFAALPHRRKVYVPGNHDGAVPSLLTDHSWRRTQSLRGISVLAGTTVSILGRTFHGAPWNRARPEHLRRPDRRGKVSAFAVPIEQMERVWAPIHDGLDVLITHIPPFGIGDCAVEKEASPRIGCYELRRRVGMTAPRLHLFGHVHDDAGMARWRGTTFVNLAICDRAYNPVRAPVVIDFTPDDLTFPFSRPDPCIEWARKD